MIEVIGGNLFQWDTGRVAQVNTDANIHEVHFTTKDMTYAYVVSTYEKDGTVYCEIPNILLQQEKSLICYEVTNTDSGEMTVAETTLALHKRNKPQDYAYTQDELKNFDRLAALIPTKLSQLTDDIGAGGAKITSVNGILPDENGNVVVQAGTQPDWNQNDETAPDYVKNRPFYTGDAVLQDIVPATDVEIKTGTEIILATGVEHEFEVGKQYIVSMDGTETAYTSYEYGGTICVGDEFTAVIQGSGYVIYGAGSAVVLTTMDTSLVGDHSIGIKTESQPIIKVPEKYLPKFNEVLPQTFWEQYTEEKLIEIYQEFLNGKVFIVEKSTGAPSLLLYAFYSDTVGFNFLFTSSYEMINVQGIPDNWEKHTFTYSWT